MRHGTEHLDGRNAKVAGTDASLLSPLGIKSWRGASGRSFVHVVYSLIGCPMITKCSYLLVKRSEDGRRSVISVGSTVKNVPSLDLAHIRKTGALSGANEVHVYQHETDALAAAAEFDLASAFMPNDVRSSARH